MADEKKAPATKSGNGEVGKLERVYNASGKPMVRISSEVRSLPMPNNPKQKVEDSEFKSLLLNADGSPKYAVEIVVPWFLPDEFKSGTIDCSRVLREWLEWATSDVVVNSKGDRFPLKAADGVRYPTFVDYDATGSPTNINPALVLALLHKGASLSTQGPAYRAVRDLAEKEVYAALAKQGVVATAGAAKTRATRGAAVETF